MFLIASGLAGLGANAAEPVLHFFDDVGKPQHVLFDTFKPSQRFEFTEFEPADAGRLLEDDSAIARRRLQKDVHLALLNDAVGLRTHARPGEQVADVAEPGRCAVQQVLALAAAIDAAGNMDLGRVDRQQVFGIVEGERDLGGVGGPATARAVKDHVGHLAAAEAFDALLAQHPLNSVDDVRLARAVRPHHDRDAGGKLEPGAVGKALETNEF